MIYDLYKFLFYNPEVLTVACVAILMLWGIVRLKRLDLLVFAAVGVILCFAIYDLGVESGSSLSVNVPESVVRVADPLGRVLFR